MRTEDTRNYEDVMRDPLFQALLSRRSSIRWTLASFLSLIYFAYGMAGHYFPDSMSKPFFGSSMPWVMAVGFLIIFVSILLSILYIRIINRIEDEHDSTSGSAR